jgi:hypothetical protein
MGKDQPEAEIYSWGDKLVHKVVGDIVERRIGKAMAMLVGADRLQQVRKTLEDSGWRILSSQPATNGPGFLIEARR